MSSITGIRLVVSYEYCGIFGDAYWYGEAYCTGSELLSYDQRELGECQTGA